jgi:hypothetical protein
MSPKDKNNNLGHIIAIVVALIGLVGVIYLAYATFLGPVVAAFITRNSHEAIVSTPTIQPTLTSKSGCEELSSMSLSETPEEPNFENRNEKYWAVTDDGTGNIALRANTFDVGTDIRSGPEFSNGCIEFRFKLADFDTDKDEKSGQIEFHFRLLEETQGYSVEESYILAFLPKFDRSGLVYRNENNDDWEDLMCGAEMCRFGSLRFKENKKNWFYVTVVVQGANIDVYLKVEGLDDFKWKNIASTQDSRLAKGIFSFGVGPYATVYFDDFKVWKSKP